jgi:KaiC/GvpD/RAD55 family RecA-like ATPase
MAVDINQHMEELYNAALEFLDHGWSFVPTSVLTKRPLFSWKELQDRQPTEDEVESWFTEGIHIVDKETGEIKSTVRVFNLAVITGAVSGIVVVDADSQQAIQACEEAGLSTPFSVTTRRGRHFYFRHPGHQVRNSVNIAGIEGVDFRGDGGYVVAPPGIRKEESGELVQYYVWDRALDWDDLPVWQGVDAGGDTDFRFEDLDLTNIGTEQARASIWEITRLDVAANGKYGGSGRSGRNNLMTKFVGELLRQFTPFEEILGEIAKFQDEFFLEELPEAEIKTIVESVVNRDRKQNPENYDENGRLKPKEERPKPGRRLIFADDIKAIRDKIGNTDFLIDPWLAPSTIVQVFGYNGHGKSMFVSQALWHLAMGKDFGPYSMSRKARVLYCDWENPPLTIADRMEMFTRSFGHPGENFAFWSPALLGDEMNLKEENGRIALAEYVEMFKPDVLVIDTVRSAYPGLEENKAADWAPVNQLAKHFRNRGVSVILLHHSTKPNQDGLMGESGSSSQLTDLDQQLQVMQLFKDKKRAAAKRGGYAPVIWDDLSENMPDGFNLKHVFEARYRKVRQETDNHVTGYIGVAIDDNEAQLVRSNTSPKQFVKRWSGRGMDVSTIQQRLQDMGASYYEQVRGRRYDKEELADNGSYLMYDSMFIPKRSIERMLE